jgi:flagellar basal body-associated protein FliL
MQFSLKPVGNPIYTVPFRSTVNLKNGRNYIHLVIRAVLNDQAAVAFLEARTPLIDDLIITLLKNKLPQDIRTRTGLEMLKLEFLTAFNKLFPQEFIEQSQSKDRMPVKDILFVEYFIQ